MTRIVLGLVAALLFALPLRAGVAVEEVTSPGGIRAWLVEEHEIPFVALEIGFRGGSSLDPAGARGAVRLMVGLLEEGAGERGARGFAEAREALAARFGFDVDGDGVTVSARFLSENRDRAIALLRDALTAPRFDAEAIERVRGQVAASIRDDSRNPSTLAYWALLAAAFGPDPYGSSDAGTAESLAVLTRDDLVAAHRAALARDRVHVAAVGDITGPELGRLIDDLLGDLPATGAPLPGPAAVALEPGITVLPFAGPQSAVVFGQPGVDKDDPDFLVAWIVNEALGQDARFGTRLMVALREQRGLTYGVDSWLATYDRGALIAGSFQTANGRAAEAVEVLRREWARIAAAGLTAEELAAVKTYSTGEYPLRFDGNGRIAASLLAMQMQGRPADYILRRNGLVEAITLEQANRVAARIFDPAALRIVVVGEPAGVVTGPLPPLP